LSTLSGSQRSPQVTLGMGTLGRPPPVARNTFVSNADPDSALQAIIPAHLQLRTVIQNEPVPLSDTNMPMCLSYHLPRGCWSQCKRSADHNRKLSGAERQRIVSFLSAQLRKYRLCRHLRQPSPFRAGTLLPQLKDPRKVHHRVPRRGLQSLRADGVASGLSRDCSIALYRLIIVQKN
jgi:hypothetical protein